MENTLPITPISRRVDLAGGIAALTDGMGPRQTDRLSMAYHRAQQAGTVTIWAADRLCVELLDLHPMLVFGDDWLTALQAPDRERPDHDPTRGRPSSNSAYSRGCRCAGCARAHADYVADLARRRARSEVA